MPTRFLLHAARRRRPEGGKEKHARSNGATAAGLGALRGLQLALRGHYVWNEARYFNKDAWAVCPLQIKGSGFAPSRPIPPDISMLSRPVGVMCAGDPAFQTQALSRGWGISVALSSLPAPPSQNPFYHCSAETSLSGGKGQEGLGFSSQSESGFDFFLF